MKKTLIAASAALLLAIGYVAAPVFTAWSIREAMETGNTAYLARAIEWPTVRETLRDSLVAFAAGPTAVADTDAAAPRPGLWQRIKAGLSRRAVDNVVDAYVTPEGLPRLFGARQFYRESISGEAATDRALPWTDRARRFWSRIKRAEFHSPSAFEIEMADRNDPTRHYVGLLKLRGVQWKLVELRVLKVREAALPPSSSRA